MSNQDKPELPPIAFPPATSFGRIVAKEKILKQAKATATVKKLFQKQVERIRCSHELTQDKLNLRSSQNVPKILIIQLFLKSADWGIKILETIDKAFGVPVVFELHISDQLSYSACYRRRSETDARQWVHSDYFFSEWVDAEPRTGSLPVSLDMDSLYDQLVRQLSPLSSDEPLAQLTERIGSIRKRERELERLKSRLKKERQFNRKVEINSEIRTLSAELDRLNE